jgi:hypothetical protein
MDFITGFPRIVKQHDAIMVMVDKLSKEAHFIPAKSNFKVIDFFDVFVKEVFGLNGMPKTLISDKDAKFTSNFLKGFFVGLGMQLEFNKDYHPQTYGHTERINRVLEDMLRMHVMHQPK